MRGRVLVVAVLGLAAVGAIVAPGAVAQESSGYSAQELQECGTAGNGPDSQRFIGSYGSATVRHHPVGPGGDDWDYLAPGTTVNSNEVTLRTVRLAPESELDETLNVTVVVWQQRQRTVEVGNETTTRTVATNQSVYHHEVRLERGYDTANISLPAHYDQTWQVTMWIDEYPDARWCFAHHSVESTRSLPFAATWGGFWGWASSNLLFPMFVATGIVAMGVPKTIKRTGRGPNMGWLFWSIVLVVGGGVVGIGMYVWTTSLLATAPWIVAVLMAGLVAIVMLETMTHGVYEVGFIRLTTSEGTNPRGELAKEAIDGEWATVDIANTENGVKALSDGIRPWLARLWCGGATVRGLDRLETELSMSTPELTLTDGPADKLIFVDEAAPELLAHTPERLALSLPLTRPAPEESEKDEVFDWNGIASMLFWAGLGATIVAGIGRSTGLVPPRLGGLVGAVVAVGIVYTEAVEGHCHFVPAVGHAQDAVATAMHLEAELDEYRTLEEALEALVDERNSSDELLDRLEEMDAESVVQAASTRDSSPGEFADGTAAAGGDD